jgi:CheY-like chemotaxis protein
MQSKLNSVMVIDDDEATIFFNQLVVENSGCTDHIKVVQSGQEALDYLANCVGSKEGNCPCPSLIFLDINMPAMNGWEFLDKYRELGKEKKADIVVVMLTTSLFPEDVLKARGIPEISGFENKPLTAGKLENLLKEHFAGTCGI